MQRTFFVPFMFDDNTLQQQVLEPTQLTTKELETMKRQLIETIIREAHAIQLRIRDYKWRSPYDRVYDTTNVDPHYEAWVEEHIRLLHRCLKKQYPHLFKVVALGLQESQDKERNQRVIAALQQLLERIRSDRSALERSPTFTEYDGSRDPFQGGLCRFL